MADRCSGGHSCRKQELMPSSMRRGGNPIWRTPLYVAKSSALKGIQRCSELSKRPVVALRIAGVGSSQHGHVLGSAWVTVKCDCMATDEYKLCPHICQLQQQIAKILRELVYARSPGTNLTGMSWREYRGVSRPARAQHSRASCCTRDMAASPDTGARSCSIRPRDARLRVIVRRRWAARSLRSRSSMAWPRPQSHGGYTVPLCVHSATMPTNKLQPAAARP
jgi:hypothetical protein